MGYIGIMEKKMETTITEGPSTRAVTCWLLVEQPSINSVSTVHIPFDSPLLLIYAHATVESTFLVTAALLLNLAGFNYGR